MRFVLCDTVIRPFRQSVRHNVRCHIASLLTFALSFQILRMEHLILRVLKFDVATPTINWFAERLIRQMKVLENAKHFTMVHAHSLFCLDCLMRVGVIVRHENYSKGNAEIFLDRYVFCFHVPLYLLELHLNSLLMQSFVCLVSQKM